VRNISQLLGMPLVTVDEGQRLGRVSGVEYDPERGRIAYLKFEGDKRKDGLIPWEAVQAVGADAVTVQGVAAVQPGIAPSERDCLTPYLGDRPVVTESGERLGTITGYDFDEQTGEVRRFHIATGGFLGRLTGRELAFPPEAIRTFGKDAIIVADSVAHPREKAA
jgi:sporulation protein YlmC with PRC-barrel domain